jgi:hypothetical protein
LRPGQPEAHLGWRGRQFSLFLPEKANQLMVVPRKAETELAEQQQAAKLFKSLP